MITSLGLTCNVCQNRINIGHWFIPFVPGGYGEHKDAPLSQRFPGDMHVSHLSSSDKFVINAKVQA